jgi:epoxyqueuosine reductase
VSEGPAPERTADAACRLALGLGFDLAGVAPASPVGHADALARWAERGLGGPRGGPLDYVLRRLAERLDPRRVLPGVRSVVAVALAFDDGSPVDGEGPQVARYARGDDYHEVLGDRLRALAAALEAWWGEPVESRCYVDTGPVLERAFAAAAGLGWIGKNTMLIHPTHGSHLFLGVMLTDLEMTADAPEPDHCGSCRACLDACPTDAFVEPRVLDATRCIAYSTIEDPGPIPEALREAQGERLFGCDVCQDVCPFNLRRGRTTPPDPLGLRQRLAGRESWRAPDLAWVLTLDESAWQVSTRRSALRRAKWRGLMRNALVVAGNRGDAALRPLVERHAAGADPMLAEHARWALSRLPVATGEGPPAGGDPSR